MSSVAEDKDREEVHLDAAKVLSVTNKKQESDVVKVNAFALGITMIDNLQCFPNLTVLSLSSNSVRDISGLRCCNSLVELYLRKNNISDLRQVGYLQDLSHLNVLFLADNPCSQDENYRPKVLRVLKFLSTLDVTVVTDDDKSAVLNATDESILSFDESVKLFIDKNCGNTAAEVKGNDSTVFKGLKSIKLEEEPLNRISPVKDNLPSSSQATTRGRKRNVLEAIKLLVDELPLSEISELKNMCDDILSNSSSRATTVGMSVSQAKYC